MRYLDTVRSSKGFRNYLKTQGVKEYKYFASLPEDYYPTDADVAMFAYESFGRMHCLQYEITVDGSGNVFEDGNLIGKSKLAEGKSRKDLTITLWLEDIGQVGFNEHLLRQEMDKALGEGWFFANVGCLATKHLRSENYKRAKDDMTQIPVIKYKSKWQTYKTILKELFPTLRAKLHWWVFDNFGYKLF